MFGSRSIEVKTPAQVERMRAAGLVVAETLQLVAAAARPGATTAELDALAEDHIRSSGATPSFKGYSDPPFPASICASVNDAVVHGIPDDRPLAEGDLLSVDCGAIVDGWHGDAALTVAVGEVGDEARELMRVTEDALWRGLAAARRRRAGGRHLARGGASRPHRRSLRHRHRLHRPRHRLADAHGARGAQPRPHRAAARGWSPAWRSRSSRC